MKNAQRKEAARRGFTILELLIVISIMAVIATLATGAAIKSIKGSRERRVTSMARALEMALANYRAQENEWPFKTSDLEQDTRDKSVLWAHGADNVEVFKKMYHGSRGQSTTVYLDASALMTEVQGAALPGKFGRRVPLRTALDLRRQDDAPLGYPQPSNPNRFCFYCVCYNPLTDTLKVYREDQKHPKLSEDGIELECPHWKKRNL